MEIWTAFILGLVGSLHCAGMCGPLAMAIPGSPGRVPFLAGRLAYNGGRIITYSCLGAVFGIFGKTMALAGFQRWLSLALGAGLLIGLFATKRSIIAASIACKVGFLKQSMSSLLQRRTLAATALLGLLNGFLPCGLVYVAGAAASANGSVVSAIFYMAAFGAGTLPMMIALSLSGRMLPFRFRLRFQRLIPVSVFLLATVLILRGMALGIPYVSPNLTAKSCCQGTATYGQHLASGAKSASDHLVTLREK